MRIILLGGPGSGKGLQATRLTGHYRLPRISTSAALRQAIQDDTLAGRQARVFIDARQPVPDEILAVVLKDRFRQPDVGGGFLLAGFPRSADQAVSLDAILEELALPLDLVLLLTGDADLFMERLEGRRVCNGCGAAYNLFSSPPRVEGVCDRCGGEVRRRADDLEETVSSRMRIYEHQAPSLLQYYRLHGKLRQVRADRDPGQVFEALCRVIDEHPPTVIETEPVVERAVPLMQGDGAPGKDGVGKTVHVKKAPAQKAALKKARSKAPVSTKKAAVKNKGGAARDEKGQ